MTYFVFKLSAMKYIQWNNLSVVVSERAGLFSLKTLFFLSATQNQKFDLKIQLFTLNPSKSFSDNKPQLCENHKSNDQCHPSCHKLPAAVGMIRGTNRANTKAFYFPCGIAIKKAGLILPHPSASYWKPVNWWMRTLQEMAGVVMVVIFF